MGVAIMLATDIMITGHYSVLKVLDEDPPADVGDALELYGASLVITGKVETESESLNTVRIKLLDGPRVKFECAESFVSDIDIRVATANLDQRLSPGGQRILWRSKTRLDCFHSSPVFHDGELLLGASGPALLALSPLTGRELWSGSSKVWSKIMGCFLYTPILFEGDEWSYGPMGFLIARFDPEDGKLIGSSFLSDRSVYTGDGGFLVAEGLLFLTNSKYEVLTLKAHGPQGLKAVWKYPSRSFAKLAIGEVSDRLVVCSGNGRLSALSTEDGELLWSCTLPGRAFARPLVSSGRVYVACEDGTRLALSLSDGSEIWRAKEKGRSLASPSANTSAVFFADSAGGLNSYRIHSGEPLWSTELRDVPLGALVHHNGLLYASCADGLLYCVEASKGNVLWRVNLRGTLDHPPLILPAEALVEKEDGPAPAWLDRYEHIIYIASGDGYVYAIGGTSKGSKR